MDRLKLGHTDIEVADYCLGTMTYGVQTPEPDAHRQLDYSLDQGVDFLDTAEMYPVNPVRRETIGRTEEIIGNWFQKTGRRAEWVVATKHTGRSDMVRDRQPIEPSTIVETLEGSLRRLQTDYIDVYQFHWPNRPHYHFRQNWTFDPSGIDPAMERQRMADTMGVLKDQVDAGKIRAFGLSNDTAWGTMAWQAAAEATGGPAVSTMQNEYSLLCRHYDLDMAEVSTAEGITLLAFSPLAAGFLTGKYQNGAVPEGSRMSLNAEMGGRKTEAVFNAVDAYLDIAKRHGIDPTHLALAWTRTRPFPTIPIFGATTFEQLEVAFAARPVKLSDDVLNEVRKAHQDYPIPY